MADPLRSAYRKIGEAREYLAMDKPWQADHLLRELERSLRIELYGDVQDEPRVRLVSRGLTRGR